MRLLVTVVLALVLGVPATAAGVPPDARTRVVLTVSGCEGCRFTPSSSVEDGPAWRTSARRVRGGRVRFTMPTARTRGLRLALDAPFAGDTGGVPHVVLHYEGLRRGDDVTAYEAQSARKGSVCFAGSARPTLRLAVTVRPVTVQGDGPDGAPVTAALAYAATTQRTLRPFELVRDGYFAARAVPTCQD